MLLLEGSEIFFVLIIQKRIDKRNFSFRHGSKSHIDGKPFVKGSFIRRLMFLNAYAVTFVLTIFIFSEVQLGFFLCNLFPKNKTKKQNEIFFHDFIF
jgi:hypothetical protein